MNAWRFTPLFFTGFLVACAPTKPTLETPVNEIISTEKREAKTANISSWEINGAMAAKNNNKAWSATLNWHQQGINKYQIRLLGPLGSGAVVVERNGGLITYKDGPKTISSKSAEELLQQQTGIRLPLNNLYYWVRGLPAPGPVQSEKRDQFNHLTSLKQSGYTIDYGSYTSVNKVDLPNKIRLQGHGLLIKLIIKKWTI